MRNFDLALSGSLDKQVLKNRRETLRADVCDAVIQHRVTPVINLPPDGLFGVVLDSGANERAVGESVLTVPGSPVTAYVIPTNEEQQIARECLAQLP